MVVKEKLVNEQGVQEKGTGKNYRARYYLVTLVMIVMMYFTTDIWQVGIGIAGSVLIDYITETL